MIKHATPVKQRLDQLQIHLSAENPLLLDVLRKFRELDKVGHRTGLLQKGDSFAFQIPWWPLISVLGTFSAGKSTFINHYLGQDIQRSGNQAVDDKFTVICYSKEKTSHTLPGIAVDADPRFPFYGISDDIEDVAAGEGGRIDAYLQLKTATSENLRGNIIIDSPGFDADAQRTATLRITDHIIGLSDLVLVMFDARHPEPGAMQDTLEHLVRQTISRSDSSKFLYILNQIDSAALEDNPEDVVAAWQRALAEKGLTAGRFYSIYSPKIPNIINDDQLRKRFEAKRDADLDEIHSRMRQVETERTYRIIGALENNAREIEGKAIPALKMLLQKWRNRTLFAEAMVFGIITGFLFAGSFISGYWTIMDQDIPWLAEDNMTATYLTFGGFVLVLFVIHCLLRKLTAWSLSRAVSKAYKSLGNNRLDIKQAFAKSTRLRHSVLFAGPAGWNFFTRRKLMRIREGADRFIQQMNDRLTSPSGPSGQSSKPTRQFVDQPNDQSVQTSATVDSMKQEESTGSETAKATVA